MVDNFISLTQGTEEKRYTVDKAIIEAKKCNKMRFLVLDDGIPATAINQHLLIKQERQAHPSSTSAYNLCLFLNAMDVLGVNVLDVRLGNIYDYLCNGFVEEGKTYRTIISYIYDIAALYESLALRNFPIHESLYRPVSDVSAGPRVKRSRQDKSLTKISLLRNEFVPKKADATQISYTKWYGSAEIDAIAAELPIVYRCIFFDTVFNGHRIDSALSITMDSINLKNRQVWPTRTKTGKMHISSIPPILAKIMQTYLIEERRKIVDSTGSTSIYFFLGKDGQPVNYAAYYAALKRAGEKASSKNPSLHLENLHTHAGRSTFAAVLRSYQLEQRRQGKETLTDTDFCVMMDWKSLSCLENYDTTRAQEVSPLLKDFYSQYLDNTNINQCNSVIFSTLKEG